MITCKACDQEKSEELFYRHPRAASGRDSTCKECRKAKVRQNRADKIDYYRAYDRKRFKEDPRVKERHKRYQSTDHGKRAMLKAKRRYIEKNTVKRAAHIIVGNAIRDGRLNKPHSCEVCGDSPKRIHGHHDDYSKPLIVRWLCPKCHKEWHDENGEGANAN